MMSILFLFNQGIDVKFNYLLGFDTLSTVSVEIIGS